jgi:probable HAF family extracellular repeat protein
LVVLAIMGSAVDAQPQFFGLGDLPGGAFDSRAYGVSADGRYVVGQATTDQGPVAFRWSAATGMVPIPDGSGLHPTVATAISADGSVVAGNATGPNGTEAFIWTESSGLTGHGTLGGDYSVVNAISADGTTVVGESRFGPEADTHAFRWRGDTGMVDLGVLPGNLRCAGYAASDDGSVVGGYSFAPCCARSVRSQDGQPVEEIGLGGSPAYDVSPDGTVFFGWAPRGGGLFELATWSEVGGLQRLPDSIFGGILGSTIVPDISASNDSHSVALRSYCQMSLMGVIRRRPFRPILRC